MLQVFKKLLLFIGLNLGMLATTVATSPIKPPEILGILFYKADCPDCLEVTESILPDAFVKYANPSRILAVNNSSTEGSQLFLEVLIERNLPASLRLPILVTKDTVWSGLESINRNLPELLAASSQPQPIDPVASDELTLLIKKANEGENKQTTAWISLDSRPGTEPVASRLKANFLRDPAANGLAVVVLLGMIVSLIVILTRFFKKPVKTEARLSLLYPLLCCAVILIAFYLVYSGFTDSELSCGPVGECNTVQQSKYAYLFGTIPVSLLGLLVFLCCFIIWLATKTGLRRFSNYLIVTAWVLSSSSVLFFIYLTFLEPFVIGATCIWCLTTAILTTLSALVSTNPAHSALNSILNRSNRQ